jgi:hypothetical protein
VETQKLAAARAAWRKLSAQLNACLAQPGSISEGTAQNRGPGAGGPCYQWTRKVRGKTVSVALSKEQYEGLAAAIANWRTVQSTLKAMQRLSRSVLFATLPGTRRRKRLSKKTLGLT